MSDAPKKRGGARPGAGRRKTRLIPMPIDGRSTSGQRKAQEIIDALNRPAKDSDSYEIKQFRLIDDAGVRESLDLRRWLYDKVSGKAMQTVNHLHDKPIEHNVTLTLSERFRVAMQKAEQRVADNR